MAANIFAPRMSREKQEAFAKLKPLCVALSRLTLSDSPHEDQATELDGIVSSLTLQLAQVGYLDAQLAGYVFFPLSYIFKKGSVATRVGSTQAIRSLEILISRGWRNGVPADLATQLYILLEHLLASIERVKHETGDTENYRLALLDCLRCLALATSSDTDLTKASDERERMRAAVLYHLLDITTNKDIAYAQSAALRATKAMVESSNRPSLRQSFPGVVSSMTRLVKSLSYTVPSTAVHIQAIEIIASCLRMTMNDPEISMGPDLDIQLSRPALQFDDDWAALNREQTESAVRQVLLTRSPDTDRTREAVIRLCQVVLDRCTRTLPGLIETCLLKLLATFGVQEECLQSTGREYIQSLLIKQPDIITVFRKSLQTAFDRIAAAVKAQEVDRRSSLLTAARFGFGLIDLCPDEQSHFVTTIANKLIEGTASFVFNNSQEQAVIGQHALVTQSAQDLLRPNLADFTSIFSHGPRFDECALLIADLLAPLRVSKVRGEVLSRLREHTSTSAVPTRIVSRWLILQLLDTTRTNTRKEPAIARVTGMANLDDVMIDVYEDAVATLQGCDYPDSNVSRMRIMAVQAITLQAEAFGPAFRPELRLVLYYLMESVASSDVLLHGAAITGLHRMAKACGYEDVRRLIENNLDYLLNTVGIKLNTFNISPEGVRVLTLAFSLCGPSMLGRLDDVYESIFTMLRMYHGYVNLVTALFDALEQVMLVATRSEVAKKRIAHTGAAQEKPIVSIFSRLKCAAGNGNAIASRLSSSEDSPDGQADLEVPTPDMTKTVLSILRLSQGYLTHESSRLRAGVLRLVQEGLKNLRRSTDDLLPRINELWSLVIARLEDDVWFVVKAALQAINAMIETAGQFMTTRIEHDWRCITRTILASAPWQNRSAMHNESPAAQVTLAAVDCLRTIACHIKLTSAVQDSLIETMARLNWVPGLASALEPINGDMLWYYTQIAPHGENQ